MTNTNTDFMVSDNLYAKLYIFQLFDTTIIMTYTNYMITVLQQ